MGYQTITVNKGSTTALGIQFENVGETTEIALKDLLKIADPKGAGEANANADQIWVYENSDWTKYYYYKPVPFLPDANWAVSTDAEHTDVGLTVKFHAGQCIFFVRADAGESTCDVTLSGGVSPLGETKAYTVAKGSTTAMAWPWPEAMKIKDFQKYNPDPKGAGEANANADQIWVYENSDWTKYYYYKPVPFLPDANWALASDPDHKDIGDDKVIAPGSAFFFVRADAGDATVTISFDRTK